MYLESLYVDWRYSHVPDNHTDLWNIIFCFCTFLDFAIWFLLSGLYNVFTKLLAKRHPKCDTYYCWFPYNYFYSRTSFKFEYTAIGIMEFTVEQVIHWKRYALRLTNSILIYEAIKLWLTTWRKIESTFLETVKGYSVDLVKSNLYWGARRKSQRHSWRSYLWLIYQCSILLSILLHIASKKSESSEFL
jgi:dolichol kinase